MDNAPRPHSKIEDDLIAKDKHKSHLYYQALIGESQDIMIVLDAHHIIQDINVYGCQWLDVNNDQALGQPFEQLVSLANSDQFEHHFSLVWTTGQACRLQLYVHHRHGSWIDVELVPIKAEETEEILSLWLIARDISHLMEEMTQRQQAEQQLQQALQDKETLLQELHHRIKNNLQVVSAILSLQARFVDDADIVQVLQDSRARIHAIAMIHETLYQLPDGLEEVNFTMYLQRLVKASIFAHTDRALRITTQFDVDSIFLNLETAIPCGLLVNEVLMNALKHAFPHQKNGTIAILLKKNDVDDGPGYGASSADNPSLTCPSPQRQMTEATCWPQDEAQFKDVNRYRYSLRICDDGIGLPEALEPETMESVGMSLIRDLTYQLGGSYKIVRQKQDSGTCFQLLFSPLNYRKRM